MHCASASVFLLGLTWVGLMWRILALRKPTAVNMARSGGDDGCI